MTQNILIDMLFKATGVKTKGSSRHRLSKKGMGNAGSGVSVGSAVSSYDSWSPTPPWCTQGLSVSNRAMDIIIPTLIVDPRARNLKNFRPWHSKSNRGWVALGGPPWATWFQRQDSDKYQGILPSLLTLLLPIYTSFGIHCHFWGCWEFSYYFPLQ